MPLCPAATPFARRSYLLAGFAAAFLAVANALAQDPGYHRQIRAEDIAYARTPDGLTSTITVIPSVVNTTPDPLDLGTMITVEVNGLVVGAAAETLLLAGGGGGGGGGGGSESCGGNPCTGRCFGGHGFCTPNPFIPSWCMCWPFLIGGGLEYTLPSPLDPGDTITVRLSPLPGSEPEIYTADDEASIVAITCVLCPADTNCDAQFTPADIATFISAWVGSLQGGTLAGDFDGNGTVAPADIAVFINAWFSGVTNGC
ncbi:MAG: hypothetical protein KF745_14645 [Phycisphaeraceae bacterium]|nr:hypothetical protein [Phycisphaeraceae bacterium]